MTGEVLRGFVPALDALALVMRTHGVRRLRFQELDIEMQDHEAWVAAEPAAAAPPAASTRPVMGSQLTEDLTREPESTCACGHDFLIEHNETGCLMGCALAKCGPALAEGAT